MTEREAFAVLGIKETTDEKEVKNAYREKLAVTNPEENPEGFMRLREAIETIKRYIEAQQNSEEKPKTEVDCWIDKIAEIYKHRSTRLDPKAWEEAFKETATVSIDLETEYTEKLLVFFMPNYRLPGEIWKLVDKTFRIIENMDKLSEKFPREFLEFIAARATNEDDEEEIDYSLAEGPDDAPIDEYFDMLMQITEAMNENNTERAEEIFKDMKNLGIYHPAQDGIEAEILYRQDKIDEAIELFKKTIEYAPKHIMSNYRLANYYYDKEDYENAEKCIENIADNVNNQGVAEFFAKVYEKRAIQQLEKFEKDRTDYEAAYEYAADLYGSGQSIKADCFIDRIITENLIPEDNFYRKKLIGIQGRVALFLSECDAAISYSEKSENFIQGELDKAIAKGDKEEIKKNRNRIIREHMVRAQAYKDLALKDNENYKKAIEEYKFILERKPDDEKSIISMAYCYSQLGMCDDALEICQRIYREFGEEPASAIGLDCAFDARDISLIEEYSEICLRVYPKYMRSYEILSDMYMHLKKTEELDKLEEKARENEVDCWDIAAAKRFLSCDYISEEEAEKGLDELWEKYISPLEDSDNKEEWEKFWSNYNILQEEQTMERFKTIMHDEFKELYIRKPAENVQVVYGYFLYLMRDIDGASQILGAVIEKTPDYPYCLRKMAQVSFVTGHFDDAVRFVKRAVLISESGEYQYSDYKMISRCYRCSGQFKKAEIWNDKLIEFEGTDVYPGNYAFKAMCKAGCKDTGKIEKILSNIHDDDDYVMTTLDDAYSLSREKDKKAAVIKKWEKLSKKLKYTDYFQYRALFEITDNENIDAAFEYFSKMIEIKGDISKFTGTGQITGFCDALFNAILFERRDFYDKYVDRARAWHEAFKNITIMSDAATQRIFTQRDIMLHFYEYTDEQLDEMLEAAKKTAICSFCVECFCKELFSAQMLLLLRQKKYDEVRKLIEKNDALQYDDYLECVKVAFKLRKGLCDDSRD